MAAVVQPPAGESAIALLRRLGVAEAMLQGESLGARTPISGEVLARVRTASPAEVNRAVEQAHAAFLAWRGVPAPRRGELVRFLGEELRADLEPLAQMVTLEAGKILSEGRGEVQEMIDVCTFAATVAADRRAHAALGAAAPPHDGDLASAGRRGGDLGV